MISKLRLNQILLESSSHTCHPGEILTRDVDMASFPIDEHLVISKPSSSYPISPIHVSTLSCLRIVKKGTWEEWEGAIDILDLLIAAGANVNLQVACKIRSLRKLALSLLSVLL